MLMCTVPQTDENFAQLFKENCKRCLKDGSFTSNLSSRYGGSVSEFTRTIFNRFKSFSLL